MQGLCSSLFKPEAWTKILDLTSERPEPGVRGYSGAHPLFPLIYPLEAVSSCWNSERTTEMLNMAQWIRPFINFEAVRFKSLFQLMYSNSFTKWNSSFERRTHRRISISSYEMGRMAVPTTSSYCYFGMHFSFSLLFLLSIFLKCFLPSSTC